MTLHPVLPAVALLAVLAVVATGRVVALRGAHRTSAARWRWAVLSAAALLLLVAAARPVGGVGDESPNVAGSDEPNVFLIVDRSAQMRVEDGGDGRSRMAAARDDIAAVIDHYPTARFAVIAFASRPSLDWPLSADAWSLRAVLSVVGPYPATPASLSDTNAAAAGNMLRYQLINAVQQYPRAQNLVFYFGAGASESRSAPGQFNLPAGAVDGGAVLGYGTGDGGPIPELGGVTSTIDEETLRTIAAQIGVPYVHRSAGSDLADVLPAADGPQDGQIATSAARTESYWLFALGGASLILLELFLVLREFRRTRPVNVDVTT